MLRKGWLARCDTMFVRLFLAMATIMVAVHLLGETVIENVFPRPGHEALGGRFLDSRGPGAVRPSLSPTPPPPGIFVPSGG